MISEFSSRVLSSAVSSTSRDFDIPWLNEVCYSEDCAKHYADASNSYICNTKERVLATHHRSSGYDNRFRPSIYSDGEI